MHDRISLTRVALHRECPICHLIIIHWLLITRLRKSAISQIIMGSSGHVGYSRVRVGALQWRGQLSNIFRVSHILPRIYWLHLIQLCFQRLNFVNNLPNFSWLLVWRRNLTVRLRLVMFGGMKGRWIMPIFQYPPLHFKLFQLLFRQRFTLIWLILILQSQILILSIF